MKILITGANGFLGRHVATEALNRGHSVRAMIRPASAPVAELTVRHSGLEIARCDLRDVAGLERVAEGCDAVVHLAAAKSGDLYAQLEGTVIGTENLLAALGPEPRQRLILTGTFSVYDYRSLKAGSVIDESTPLEARPERRDEYCQTKLLQERLVRAAGERDGLRFTIVRPGVIYGREELWTARLGVRVSDRLWVRIGGSARLPLVHTDSCAELLLLCAEDDRSIGETLNAVDDETPTQATYMEMLAAAAHLRPRVVGVPWTGMRAAAWLAWLVNRRLLGGRAKVPQILNPPSLHARCKPFRYSNRKARELVGWVPESRLRETVAQVAGRMATHTRRAG